MQTIFNNKWKYKKWILSLLKNFKMQNLLIHLYFQIKIKILKNMVFKNKINSQNLLIKV